MFHGKKVEGVSWCDSKLFEVENVKFGMSCVKIRMYFKLWVFFKKKKVFQAVGCSKRCEESEQNWFCDAALGN